jgi:hypothetical protein
MRVPDPPLRMEPNLAAMRSILCAVLLLALSTLQGQPPCSCAEEHGAPFVETDTVFVLDSTLAVGYCGWIDRSKEELRYSEFTLRWCMNQWPLLVADATREFRINVVERTLVAEDLRILPSGTDLHMGVVVWRTHVIEGLLDPETGEVVAMISEVPGDLHPITAKEEEAIRARLKLQDANAPWRDEQLLGLLFLSAASDRRGAEKRFRTLRRHYRIDGAYAEQYNELLAMLDVVVEER